jgi:hypothetical protein
MQTERSCLNRTAAALAKTPRKLYLATLGAASLLPQWTKETLPQRVNHLLIDTENLANRCLERGEIIVEEEG